MSEPDTYPYPPEKHAAAPDQTTMDVKAAALLVESAVTRGDLDAADRGIRVLERIVHRKRVLAAVPESVRDLLAWKATMSPRVRRAADDPADPPPFFSEACLYALLGKEDARTLLSRLRLAFVECGCDEDEIRSLL
jgi:hypothetical protein